MWFKNKQQDEVPEVAPRTTLRGRNTDIRSELGIGGSSASSVSGEVVRSRPARHSTAQTTNTSAMYNEEVQLNDLKVRARRRLIGAFILLAAALVILPWVFDDNHKVAAPIVTVSVPDKNLQFDVKNPYINNPTATLTTEKNQQPSETKSSTADKAAIAVAATSVPKPDVSVARTMDKKSKYIVHIGVVSNVDELNRLLKRLSAAGVQATTEKIKVAGVTKTRVRLGPFTSQAEAQTAANKAKGAAKNPVVISLKSSKS